MKKCTKCEVAKPLDAFYGDSQKNDGLESQCKSCRRLTSKAYRDKKSASKPPRPPNKYANSTEKARAWRERNQAAHQASIARRDKTKQRVANKRWRLKNIEAQRARTGLWAKENPALAAAAAARRRAQRKRAIPSWADKSLTTDMYKLAAVYREFGFSVSVDHIVPLQSRFVCGLHTPANLQILPSLENSSKRNLWWPDMPGSA